MDEERNEEVQEETNENVSEESNDEREEETKDEIRNGIYVNDDEIEMLKSIDNKFNMLEEKLDNIISMFVDSGAIVQEGINEISEQEKEDYEDYEDDFINIDEMDLSL